MVLHPGETQLLEGSDHLLGSSWDLGRSINEGPKGHINTRISHPGSKAQYEGKTRNRVS